MQIIYWIILPQLAIVGLAIWLFRMPDRGALPEPLLSIWYRLRGENHRLLKGNRWDPGEHELYRAQLLGVTAYTIDRHIKIQQRSTCIVTNQRIMMSDSHGRSTQIRARELRSVRTHRTYDTRQGFSYSVVVERLGSHVHEPEGDLSLICASQEQSRELAVTIERLCSLVPM